MEIYISVLLFAIGIVLVVKGGDWFVDAASWIARAANIPPFIIGATIVSIATTLPEMIVSVMASVQGKNDMAVGNVVGSNIFNILFVLGGAAAISPINVADVSNPMFTIYDMIILFVFTVIVYIFILFPCGFLNYYILFIIISECFLLYVL